LVCRYWNNPEVLQKIGRAMSVVPAAGEGSAAVVSGSEEEATEEAEEEDGYEDESLLHHAASVGDVEVSIVSFTIFLFFFRGSDSWKVLVLFL
jgi:hypothetical protein